MLLGTMYYYGYGTQPDITEGMMWYEKAAEQGKGAAMEALGEIYYAKAEYRKAFTWFSKAAEKGSGVSQQKLGDMYLDGKCFAKDKREAARWFKLAEENGVELTKDQKKVVKHWGK